MIDDLDKQIEDIEINGLENYGIGKPSSIDSLNGICEAFGGKRVINDKCTKAQVELYMMVLLVRGKIK